MGGIFEKWGCARCFPSTLGHLKYLHSSNNSLNTPFVFRLGRNGFGLRWCTPAATTAATRVCANAPIKHFLNEGWWACLLLLRAWQECWDILMSLGSLTYDHIFHRGPGANSLNIPLVPFFLRFLSRLVANTSFVFYFLLSNGFLLLIKPCITLTQQPHNWHWFLISARIWTIEYSISLWNMWLYNVINRSLHGKHDGTSLLEVQPHQLFDSDHQLESWLTPQITASLVQKHHYPSESTANIHPAKLFV